MDSGIHDRSRSQGRRGPERESRSCLRSNLLSLFKPIAIIPWRWENAMPNFTRRALPGRSMVAAGLLLFSVVFLSRAGAASASTSGTPNAVLGFGSAASVVGDVAGLSGPTTAIASPPSGIGYWVVSSSGQVTNEGGVANYGSVTTPLHAPVVGIASTPDGGGYWLVGSDGGIFAIGDAGF